MVKSTDFGQTFTDTVLYSWSAPGSPGDPVFGGNRELGDYQYLSSLGNSIFGTFAARGNVNGGGINDTGMIVPFYFTDQGMMSMVPLPRASMFGLVGFGLLALLHSRKALKIAISSVRGQLN